MREGCLLRLVVKLVSGVGYRYLSSSTFFPAANGSGSSAASARISSCTLCCNSVADRDGYITGLLRARLMAFERVPKLALPSSFARHAMFHGGVLTLYSRHTVVVSYELCDWGKSSGTLWNFIT